MNIVKNSVLLNISVLINILQVIVNKEDIWLLLNNVIRLSYLSAAFLLHLFGVVILHS